MARRPENAPRISLNKLCEFMTASIPRQRRIIKDQKFPSDFMRVYYREAQEAVAMMILLKLARMKGNPSYADNWVDIAGYAACGGEIAGD